MIIWTGHGILAPILIALGAIGSVLLGERIGGTGYAFGHLWIVGIGTVLGGLLCRIVGKKLYARDTRVMTDKATGRDVVIGGSHTLFFIPMPMIGTLAVILGIAFAIFDLNSPALRERAAAARAAKKERETGEISTPATSAQKPQQFASVGEAQKIALQKYPDLGAATSEFNKAFLTLHKKYQKEKPELFLENSWPLVIADEVAKAK